MKQSFTSVLNGAAGGFYLVLLCLSHITGRKFTSFQFLVFLVLFKNRKQLPLLLVSGLLLKIVICTITDDRGITMFMTNKYADSPGSKQSYSSKPKHKLPLNTGSAGDQLTPCQHFLRSVWFSYEVNHINIVTHCLKKKKSFLEIGT